jgi:hypothetical protein
MIQRRSFGTNTQVVTAVTFIRHLSCHPKRFHYQINLQSNFRHNRQILMNLHVLPHNEILEEVDIYLNVCEPPAQCQTTWHADEHAMLTSSSSSIFPKTNALVVTRLICNHSNSNVQLNKVRLCWRDVFLYSISLELHFNQPSPVCNPPEKWIRIDSKLWRAFGCASNIKCCTAAHNIHVNLWKATLHTVT